MTSCSIDAVHGTATCLPPAPSAHGDSTRSVIRPGAIQCNLSPSPRTMLDVLDFDALAAVFKFVDTNYRFAASLVCTAFKSLTTTDFRTNVLAMNYTPSMLAWASSLPVPCPKLKCVADLGDSAKRLHALWSLGKLDTMPLAQHAAAIAQKLTDADVDVRYEAMNVLGKLDPRELAKHTTAILRRLTDNEADVRYATLKALGKLELAVLTRHTEAIEAVRGDPDRGVQLAVRDIMRKMQSDRTRRHGVPQNVASGSHELPRRQNERN